MNTLLNENNEGTKKETLYRRFWILSLMSGVEEVGCSPIDLKSFNILAYLANAVAQCYGVPPLDATILKACDGPLYPTLIWDIDRLVGMGLVRVSDIVVDVSKRLRNVSYAITNAGLDCEEQCRMLHPSLAQTGDSLRSAAMAYSRNHLFLSKEGLLARDGNYADPTVSNGEVVDFGEWVRNNATANSIEKILAELGLELRKDPAVGVNIYSRYLAAFAANRVINE
jgi:hypothetical protein